MSKASVEEIKLESQGLRGEIAENFADAALTHVDESENVLLKFLAALGAGRSSECQVLLPAVAALLHASPDEFAVLRASLGSGLGVGAWLGMG